MSSCRNLFRFCNTTFTCQAEGAHDEHYEAGVSEKKYRYVMRWKNDKKTIMEVEAGVCNGLPNQLHDICVVGDSWHVAHIVDMTHESRTPKVYNKRNFDQHLDKEYIYVGRPSMWGNPFIIGMDGTREDVIQKYKNYLFTSKLHEHLEELRGKNLVCWCAPEACHADVLLELANKE